MGARPGARSEFLPVTATKRHCRIRRQSQFTISRFERHDFGYTIEIDDRTAMYALKSLRLQSFRNSGHGLAQRINAPVHVQIDVVAACLDPIDVIDSYQELATEFLNEKPIGRDSGIWMELANLRKITLPLAITSFVLVLVQRELFVDGSGIWADQASAFIIYFNRWIWIVAVLG